MGAFFLIRTGSLSNPLACEAAAAQTLARSGFAAPTVIRDKAATIYVYPKIESQALALTQLPDGDFVFSCGTLMFRGLVGAAASEAFYRAFEGDARLGDETFGHYSLIMRKRGALHVISDRFGGHTLYCDRDKGVVSSSFLAVTCCLERLTLQKQSVFEYVFNGVVSGNETIFSEIGVLPKNARLTIDEREAAMHLDRIAAPDAFSRSDRGAFLEQATADLDRYFATVAGLFGNRVSSALSGGYDSRLLLAMLRRHGVAPRLFVYGNADDPDVRLAAQIARGEGMAIDCIDKETRKLAPDEFPEAVAQNYFATDGYGWGGILSNGAEIDERRRRTEGGALSLNGGGGEIYRNFFYLRDGSYTPRQLLWSFYGQFDPNHCTAAFDSELYYRNLEDKIFDLLGERVATLPRPTIEFLYHAFRCRSWDGKVNSINNRFGYVALPFLEHRITDHASRIPIQIKSHGAFEAELIHRIDPRLAAYPTNYGHSFVGAPPRRRVLHDLATYLRPTSFRRMTFRVKNLRKAKLPWQGYLAQEWLATILPHGIPILERLFNLDKVNSEAQMVRIASLEYALHEQGSKVGFDF